MNVPNLLIFIHAVTLCSASYLPFGRRARKNEDPEEPIDRTYLEDDEDSCPDCQCLDCNHTLPKPKKIINPYKQLLSDTIAPKPFGSFCLKCAACLAVANELEKVIEGASQVCETDANKKKVTLQEIEDNIQALCRNGFRNFQLRYYENHQIVTNKIECTTHVTNNMEDTNWTDKLRELCKSFVSRTELEGIILLVIDSMGNLTDTLCRGSGVFRDCANVASHKNIPMPNCTECC